MAKRHAAGIVGLVFLVALVVLPRAAKAEPPSSAEWLEMVRACEAVVTDQSFKPMANYAAAPFTFGKPDLKEYAVYNGPRNLVAIARVVKDIWQVCWVRETEQKDRTRWKTVSDEWTSGFEAAFPQSEYRWAKATYNQLRPFLAAIRCKGESFAFMVLPTLEYDFHFRVVISAEPSPTGAKICGAGGG